MDRAKKIVVIGDVFADMISEVQGFPEKGGRTFGTSFKRNSGGTGGNIAAGLAVLGMDTSIVCGLGDDETGEFLLEELRQSGVNTDHVKVAAGLKSGVVPIMVDEDGERVIYVLVKGSAFEAVKPEDLLFLEEMNPDAICFTGVIIGAHPVEESAILAARRWKGRAKLYFDPNLFYPADHVPEEIKEATRQLADLCDVVLTGETEMRALGISPKNGQTYIVKCGGKGSKWVDETGKERYQIPATRHRPIDTTGAGDTFMAAFVTAEAEGASVEEAMRFASVAAGIAVTKTGARNMPQKTEILETLKEYEKELKEKNQKKTGQQEEENGRLE